MDDEQETTEARREDGGVMRELLAECLLLLRDLRMPCKVRYLLKQVARLRWGSWLDIWPQVSPRATPSQIMASSMSENLLRAFPKLDDRLAVGLSWNVLGDVGGDANNVGSWVD